MHLGEGFLGEEVALEAQVGLTRDERQRVRQCVEDEVVGRIGSPQERSPVIDDDPHPRVLIRLVGVALFPQGHQLRVDLNCVDAPDTVAQGDGDVRAVASPHHECSLEAGSRVALVRSGVQRLLLESHGGGQDRLVRNAVDVDPHLFGTVRVLQNQRRCSLQVPQIVCGDLFVTQRGCPAVKPPDIGQMAFAGTPRPDDGLHLVRPVTP